MSDITTIETVDAGEYTVRVGQTNDGTAWEAVVLSRSDNKPDRQLAFPHPVMNMAPSTDETDETEPIGPAVTAPHRWVAIGFAIEALEWDDVNENPVGVGESYNTLRVNGEPIGEVDSVQLDADTIVDSLQDDLNE
jgi:hypothetical protein